MSTSEINSWPGSGQGRVNEDYALADMQTACALLIDGATGLTKCNLVEGTSDAAWYAKHLASSAIAELGNPDTSIARALEVAGKAIAESYLALPGGHDLERIDYPNGSLAVFRWQGDHVEMGTLGDCVLVALMRDGTAVELFDPTLPALDQQNYERMARYAQENDATMAQARRALNPRFIENRLKMNEPGGYWAADITCRGMSHVTVRTLPASEVACLFACSDGFAAAVEMEVASSHEELARRVARGEGTRIGELLRAAEQADADLLIHHRSKISDDATYLLIHLDEVAN